MPVKSKAKVSIDAEVYVRNEKQGHFTMTDSHVTFYRPRCSNPAARYSYKQLMNLIEKDLAE